MAEWRNQTSIPRASNKRPSSSFLRRVCSLGAAFLALLLLAGPALADIVQEETAPAKRALLADYGLYTADVSDTLHVAADIALQKKTYRIPLEPGLLFGIRFVPLSAGPAGSEEEPAEMALAVRISYPAPAPHSASQAGEEGADASQSAGPQAIQSYTHTRMLQPGQLYFEGLRISDAAHFVPGPYTFELLLDGEVQLSRAFELYLEAPQKP